MSNEDGKARELTDDAVFDNEIDAGEWFTWYDDIFVDLHVTLSTIVPSEKIQIAKGREHPSDEKDETLDIIVGNGCAELVIGSGWSTLEDLMYDHTRRKKDPLECPGYIRKGYARWLLGLIDWLNNRFNSHTCSVWDAMYFLPGAGPAIAHNISPFLVIIRGYSLYEDLGYLPMSPVRTFSEMKMEIDKVNEEMKRRHAFLTDKATFERIVKPFVGGRAVSSAQKAKLQKIEKRVRLKLAEIRAAIDTQIAYINAYHSKRGVLFTPVMRIKNQDELAMYRDSYSSTEFVWRPLQESTPVFISDLITLTVAEAERSDGFKLPMVAYKMANTGDESIVEAALMLRRRNLYLVYDEHIAEKANALVAMQHTVEMYKLRSARALSAVKDMSRNTQFADIVNGDDVVSIRTAVKAIIEVFDYTDSRTQLWAQRFYRAVLEELKVESNLNKVFRTFDDHVAVNINRTKDRRTGAPQFHISYRR